MTDQGFQKEMHQAGQFQTAGNLAAAEGVYRQILDRSPGFHPAYHALGLIALNVNKPGLAAELVGKAAELAPKVPEYLPNLCEINRRLNRLDAAIKAGEKAIGLGNRNVSAHYNLALALSDHGEYDKAIHHYREAVKIDPTHGLAWNNLGSTLEKRENKADALAAYSKAVALNPAHAEAQNNMGAIHSEQGDLDQARKAFSAAIESRPDFVEAHHNLSSLKTYTPTDPHLALLEKMVSQSETLAPEARIRYRFALGKARDDIGDHDGAFSAWEEGNRLKHLISPYDESNEQKQVRQLLDKFTRGFFDSRQKPLQTNRSDRTPVFIVGMPRSGTTLIEQVLSSHPAVYGAGELGHLNSIITSAKNRAAPDKTFVEWALTLSREYLNELGREYLDQVWKLSPDSNYITDKMPANFFYCGLIYLMFPDAKIIHSMRNPMDSCLSCYSRLFNQTMFFAYDLETLGRYYCRYMELMEHWHRVLLPGTILDIQYEDNVADLETQARKMLDFIGLSWHENCLLFYENKRNVKTASIAQVRKPIYTSSVEKWRRYGSRLNPLHNIVNKYQTLAGDQK